MVRIGVIGVGTIGKDHVKRLSEGQIQRCQLTAICDIDPPKMEPYSGVKKFKSSRKLIRSGLVDAVIVATPHYFHTTIGIDALQQGLHVLVEKPISVHRADAERLLAAHTNPKQVFAVMFQQRTQGMYRKLKEMLASGELGRIQRVSWIMTDWFRTEAYYASGGWRATWKGEGGGVLFNQAVHTLDMFQWLCGMPKRIRAYCALGKYHNIETEDEVTAYLEYPNGATGVFITTTGEMPGTNRLEIAADHGKLVAEDKKITLFKNETPTSEYVKGLKERFGKAKATRAEVPYDNPPSGHGVVLQNFVDAILDGTPLIAPAEEGIHSVDFFNAMLFSSIKDQMVELPVDGQAYERMLKRLIRESTFQKKTMEVKEGDLEKSFS